MTDTRGDRQSGRGVMNSVFAVGPRASEGNAGGTAPPKRTPVCLPMRFPIRWSCASCVSKVPRRCILGRHVDPDMPAVGP